LEDAVYLSILERGYTSMNTKLIIAFRNCESQINYWKFESILSIGFYVFYEDL
jgi:hypothetical protein